MPDLYEGKTVDVLGIPHRVEYRKKLVINNEECWGYSFHEKHTIAFQSGQSLERQESTMIHEILELLNVAYEWDLPHDRITQLERGLYACGVRWVGK